MYRQGVIAFVPVHIATTMRLILLFNFTDVLLFLELSQDLIQNGIKNSLIENKTFAFCPFSVVKVQFRFQAVLKYKDSTLIKFLS